MAFSYYSLINSLHEQSVLLHDVKLGVSSVHFRPRNTMVNVRQKREM